MAPSSSLFGEIKSKIDPKTNNSPKPNHTSTKDKNAAKSASTSTKTKEEKTTPVVHVCPEQGIVPVYYDAASGSFYARNTQGEYQRYPEGLLNALLKSKGFTDKATHQNGLTYQQQELLRIAQENSVHYAGPLGGYPPGLHEMNGCRALATRGRKPLVPVKGNWPIFRQFLKELLGPECKYFLAWIQAALNSLDAGTPWSAGQLLALAGPTDCGKSVLQTYITTMLGGRVSSPYKYMAGATNFNAEIFGAEHGLIGDQNHKYDKNSRRSFGATIKDLVVNSEQYVRGMWKGAMTLSTFLRLTLTLNDNPQALLVLPEMDSDVADKIMLLHAHPVHFPFPCKQFADMHEYSAAIRAELPMFLWHLRRWKPPEAIYNRRYGVVSYKSPKLIEKMSSLSSEWKLWNLIEMYVFRDREKAYWEGTSAELERLLRDQVKSENLSWLFYYPGACGMYLAALAPHLDGLIEITKIGGNRNSYVIYRPIPAADTTSSS